MSWVLKNFNILAKKLFVDFWFSFGGVKIPMFVKYSLTAGAFVFDIGGEYSPTSLLVHQLTPEKSVVKWYLYSLDLINFGALVGNGFFEMSINCNTSFSSEIVRKYFLVSKKNKIDMIVFEIGV